MYSFLEAKALMAEQLRRYTPSKTIHRIEIKVQPLDQIGWLAAQTASVKVFGANQEDTAAIAGVGEALIHRGYGPIDFAKVLTRLRRFLSPEYPYLQWYGGFCFSPSRHKGWGGFGSWCFVLPRFELARNAGNMIFCCNLIGRVNKAHILKGLAALKPPVRTKSFDLKASHRQDQPEPGAWQKAVENVLGHIARGRCRKVVLARKTDLLFKKNLNPWAILKTLKKVTPRSYHFAFGFGQAVFLGASPERLYKRQSRAIWSEALAGTKPISLDPDDLFNSLKDRHEHQLVVEAIASGLKPLCGQLDFNAAPRIVTLSNGHHLNTKFQGYLKDGVRDEDVLKLLHPTPALGGSPKDFALKAIRRLEGFSRGWYAGPLGYVGLDWAEFVVGIRSGLVQGKHLSVYAGAGIVQGSNPGEEWREIENKISNFIKIIK